MVVSPITSDSLARNTTCETAFLPLEKGAGGIFPNSSTKKLNIR